uniref:RBD domain-containing protein n=1 Tax=Knipowitschia caucasica TaxID=637954 RepID=A0AAV2J963_KNICA
MMGHKSLEMIDALKRHRKPTCLHVFADGEDSERSPEDSVYLDHSKEHSKSEDSAVQSLTCPRAESGEVWLPDHLTPSWVCLPNDQPVLTTIQPGDSALCLLETISKAHDLDPTKHYLRLKFLMENQVQFYIPKPEEDVCDLVSAPPNILPAQNHL